MEADNSHLLQGLDMEPRILVPIDGSATSEKTIQAILDDRERFPLPLVLLHVLDVDKFAYRMIPDFQVDMIRENARKAGELLLQKQLPRFLEAGFRAESRLEMGSPREVVTRLANEENIALVVLGRRRQGEVRDILFGSVANYVLHHVRCPVLLF